MSKRDYSRRTFIQRTGTTALAALLASRGAAGEPPEGGAGESTPALLELLDLEEALFRPTARGCTVHWMPRVEVDAQVLAGPGEDRLGVVHESRSSQASTVVLDGSKPDTDLYLQCRFRKSGASEWITRPVRRIHTARNAGSPFRVALLADSHIYYNIGQPQAAKNLHNSISRAMADRPDFVIFLGDEAGITARHDLPGFMRQQRADERWHLWRATSGPLLSSLPSFMVLGNHEGEAGFYQSERSGPGFAYYQRWGTIARKRHCLNPLPETYPEGGENEGWAGDPKSEATGGGEEGNCSPLQNYYAWSWGDALFVVLDVLRYTNVGNATPSTPHQWTLGAAQLQWLERVLSGSRARWKFVIGHHVVGGSEWDLEGKSRITEYAYGRGGARYARVGEQARVTEIMRKHGARFYLYGHDHVFCHQKDEDISYVCCGRTTTLSYEWWRNPGWKEAYGEAASRNPHDFFGAIGYTRLTIAPEKVDVEYIRTGTDPWRKENVEAPEGEVVYGFTEPYKA